MAFPNGRIHWGTSGNVIDNASILSPDEDSVIFQTATVTEQV
jgi:hypothetical protein